MVLNEADIAEVNIRHLFAEGIDKMYLAIGDSFDGTWDIIEQLSSEFPIHMEHDDDEVWHQTSWTNRLIVTAGEAGHEWILPFDMDEFVYSTDRSKTIAEALADCPHDKLWLRQWAHHDWSTREVDCRRLPKVAFRYSPNISVNMGAHDASIPGGVWDVLDIRELQFRSLDHFIRKVRERNARLDPEERRRGNGAHMTCRDGMDDEGMANEWAALLAIPTVADPIPSRIDHKAFGF